MEHATSFYFLVPLLQLPPVVYQTITWALRWSGTAKDQQNSFLQALIEEDGFIFNKRTEDLYLYVAKEETELFLIQVSLLLWSWSRENYDGWIKGERCIEFILTQKSPGLVRLLRWSIYPSESSYSEEFLVWEVNHNGRHPTSVSREQLMTIFHNFCLDHCHPQPQ